MLAIFLPQAGKSTQDTEVSSLKQLLDEFADEGVVDLQLHNHELEKPGLAAGSDSSGLGCSMLQLMHLCTKTITKMRLACYVRPEGDITYFIKPKPSQARCGSTQEGNKMLLLLILIRDGGEAENILFVMLSLADPLLMDRTGIPEWSEVFFGCFCIQCGRCLASTMSSKTKGKQNHANAV